MIEEKRSILERFIDVVKNRNINHTIREIATELNCSKIYVKTLLNCCVDMGFLQEKDGVYTQISTPSKDIHPILSRMIRMTSRDERKNYVKTLLLTDDKEKSEPEKPVELTIDRIRNLVNNPRALGEVIEKIVNVPEHIKIDITVRAA